MTIRIQTIQITCSVLQFFIYQSDPQAVCAVHTRVIKPKAFLCVWRGGDSVSVSCCVNLLNMTTHAKE